MTGLVYRKELLAMARDGRAVALALALAALLAGMLITSLQQHDLRVRELAQAGASTRQQWDAQGDKHPHRGAHFGLYVFRPVSVLAALDPGLTPYTGAAVWLEPHRRNTTRFEPAADALPSDRFGRLDVTFVLSALVPLLIVVLAFDAISRERESGSLRMLHGIGVSPWRLLTAKFCALMTIPGIVATVPVVAVAIAASTAAGWQGTGEDGADLVWRAAALSAAHLLHLGIFTAIALTVSARCATSRAALYWLIGWWLIAVFVLPRAAAAVADHLEPLPAASAFWSAIQRDYQHGLPGDGDLAARTQRFDAALLRKHGVKRPDDLPVGAAPLRRLERDAYADRVHALHFDALWARYGRQERMLRFASLGSPTLALRNLSMKLAATDLSHQRHFEAAAEGYRRHVNTAIDGWDAANTRGLTSFESKYAGDALWRGLPQFAYASPSVCFALRSAAPDIVALLGWCVVALVLLMMSARRLIP